MGSVPVSHMTTWQGSPVISPWSSADDIDALGNPAAPAGVRSCCRITDGWLTLAGSLPPLSAEWTAWRGGYWLVFALETGGSPGPRLAFRAWSAAFACRKRFHLIPQIHPIPTAKKAHTGTIVNKASARFTILYAPAWAAAASQRLPDQLASAALRLLPNQTTQFRIGIA
jgi:hypothetical protein